MIKVLHIADLLENNISGVYKHIKLINQFTDKEKIKHYLIYSNGDLIARDFKSDGGFALEVIDLNSKIPVKAIWVIKNFIERYDIDILHTHFTKSYLIAGILNIFLKKKVIVNYHGLIIANQFYNHFEKKIIISLHNYFVRKRILNLMLSCSKSGVKQLTTETPNFRNIHYYYNGGEIIKNNHSYDTMKFKTEYKIQESFYNIIFAGRITEQKNPFMLLNIMQLLKEKDSHIRLHIFGNGDLFDDLLLYSKSMNLENCVYFHGYLANISKFFYLFDLLILTSNYEGIPFVIWEAMSNGLPLVGPEIDGIKEIIEDTKAGVLFKINDNIDAAEKIFQLYNDKVKSKCLGKNGKMSIINNYNYINFGKQLSNIYINI
ncbi:MAG: glycosyltransferase [Ignavibacteriales bacterium]|nr:glycosyltransferase [Ignavibacteriales bacterium]MCB9209110.1 glycosyltransferase [Ignavibacteriales bacterium]MCB9260358.1 glycosyltransferase [Ignavibacteriales bacterium]